MQDIEKQLAHAQQLLKNGEVDACFTICEKIEKKFLTLSINETPADSYYSIKEQYKNLLYKLNKLMINQIRQKI